MQETLIGYEAPLGGPSYIGQLAEVAVGAFTQIEEIIAPVQVVPGDLVTVEARVRNLHTSPIYIATTARYNGVDILPTEDYAIVDPGATRSFYFSFMPDNDIRLSIWSFYWTGTEWYQDDYSYVDIALEVPPEEGELMAYSSISITAPSSAKEGEEVSVSVGVTNITVYDLPFRVKIYAVRDIYAVPEPEELIGSFEEVITNGTTKTYSASFTMPAWDATILVMVHRFVTYWDYDTHASKVVSLEVPLISLWPLAIIGSVGVLGVLGIGAVALATRRE